MDTVVYIMRHSIKEQGFIKKDKPFEEQHKKVRLSNEGKKRMKSISKLEELKNIDYIYASDYLRAIETANYIAKENKKEVIIEKNFGERLIGINYLDEYSTEYENNQYIDNTLKINNGENQLEVRQRMEKELHKVLTKHKSNRIVIVSHMTAITFLLMKWCTVAYYNGHLKIIYNKKTICDKQIDMPEIFKLTFDKDLNIKNIEYINY